MMFAAAATKQAKYLTRLWDMERSYQLLLALVVLGMLTLAYTWDPVWNRRLGSALDPPSLSPVVTTVPSSPFHFAYDYTSHCHPDTFLCVPYQLAKVAVLQNAEFTRGLGADKHDTESRKEMFVSVYNKGVWKSSPDTPGSGSGSTMAYTAAIRTALRELIRDLRIGVFLDAPCGDLTWMRDLYADFHARGVEYYGLDIVRSLVDRHRVEFDTAARTQLRDPAKGYVEGFTPSFFWVDMVHDVITGVPVTPRNAHSNVLLFSRQALQHLNYVDVLHILHHWSQWAEDRLRASALQAFREGGDNATVARPLNTIYLLTTSYNEEPSATKGRTSNFFTPNHGHMAWIDLQREPYGLPTPIKCIHERNDDRMCLWKLPAVRELRPRLLE